MKCLADPAYQEEKEFLREDMRHVREGTVDKNAQAYLAWLGKNHEKIGQINLSAEFEKKAIDLYIRETNSTVMHEDADQEITENKNSSLRALV